VGAAFTLGTTLLPTVPAEGRSTPAVLSAADLSYREVSARPAGVDAATAPLALSAVSRQPARVDRLRIPAIGVDAPLAVAGRDESGVMAVPDNAHTVNWYDFTAIPGSSGNAVLAGHFDYRGIGPAVFWNLRRLRFGDTIDVTMSDGSIYRYQVVSTKSYTLQNAPVQDIIGQTTFDAVTLITCGGQFNSAVSRYSERLVVRGQRVW
jgi:LPXTG-site transpeptidase (sortase) family protein